MKTTVKIEGLAALDAALGELPKATGKNVLRRVLKEAAKPFDERWRELAPKDTGALAESGGVGTKLTRRQAAEAKKEDRSTAYMYAGAGGDPAAVQQEFGNREQPPQPFMRPAWEQTKDGMLETIAGSLGGEINKAAERLARKAARALKRAGG